MRLKQFQPKLINQSRSNIIEYNARQVTGSLRLLLLPVDGKYAA